MTLPKTQRAIIVTAPGGPDVLKLESQRPLPVPGAGDVLIEIVAAGVNRHDCHQRITGPSHDPNPIPGLEVAGRIVACGADVARSRLGEEVIALTDGGGYGEYVVAPSELALPRPPGMDWIAAAGLPEALFTTWLNFFDLMQLAKGETVMIHGGASGVGSAAIQLLKALGHDVYATAGNEAKRHAALRLGARAVFDYNDPELAKHVLEATGQRGIDTLLDMSGGAHFQQDLAMLAPDGRMSFLSPGSGLQPAIPVPMVMSRRIRIMGAMLRRSPVQRKKIIAEQLRRIVWPLLGTAVVPQIEVVYPLAQAAEAHRHIERNAHIGKIMLSVREG